MTEQSTPKNNCTKLIFSQFDGEFADCEARRMVTELNGRMTNLPLLNTNLGYGFTFQMPTVKWNKQEEEYTETGFFTGKQNKKKRVTGANVLLEFANPLTDAELYFWRVFKLGFLSKHFYPKCW